MHAEVRYLKIEILVDKKEFWLKIRMCNFSLILTILEALDQLLEIISGDVLIKRVDSPDPLEQKTILTVLMNDVTNFDNLIILYAVLVILTSFCFQDLD